MTSQGLCKVGNAPDVIRPLEPKIGVNVEKGQAGKQDDQRARYTAYVTEP